MTTFHNCKDCKLFSSDIVCLPLTLKHPNSMISGLVDAAIACEDTSAMSVSAYQRRKHISAWCYYEWIITIDQEVNHIWRQKWNISTWTFAVTRYTSLFLNILQILPGTSQMVSEISTASTFHIFIYVVYRAQR